MITVLVSSCDRLFVEELGTQHVKLYSPTNSVTIKNPGLTFSWQEVDHASFYRLLIVSKSFSDISEIVLDTLVQDTTFYQYLIPSSYEWTVTAGNYYYSATSDTFSFTIDSSGISPVNSPKLISPVKQYINEIEPGFSWESIPSAEKYRIDIREGAWNDDVIDTSAIIQTTSLNYHLHEGEFSWGVQAISGNIYGSYATYTFTVDTTRPFIKKLLSPSDNYSTTTKAVLFKWNADSISVAPEFDSIYIASGQEFQASQMVQKQQTGSDSVTINFSSSGTYYWRVRRFDQAGNKSEYSASRSLTIQ